MNRRDIFQLAASALVAPLTKWWPKPTPKVEAVELADCCCEAAPTEWTVEITNFIHPGVAERTTKETR